MSAKTRAEKRAYYRGWARANPDKMRATRKRYHRNHPDASRTAFLKHHHGLTPEQWQRMYDDQHGLCYLCEKPLPADPASIHIDHDHDGCCAPQKSCPFCRRGLAHRDCNRILGFVGDDPALLESMAANLRARQVAVLARRAQKPFQLDLLSEAPDLVARYHEQTAAEPAYPRRQR